MGMTEQVIRTEAADGAEAIEQIAAIIERARKGEMTRDSALDAIGRLVGRATAAEPAETYQKPWG